MTDKHVWYELATSDMDAAQAFYHAVIGWDAAPFATHGGPEYRIFSAAGKGVAGLMPLPDGLRAPFWLGYVGVADRDAAVARATAAGATLHRVMDLPDIGRIALVGDPQGVGYAMIEGYGDRPSEAFDQALPGHGAWHELHTTDPAAAFDYYAGQHGWTKGHTIPMGPMGEYQLVQADGVDIAGIMKAPDGVLPGWTYYFGVHDIDSAQASIAANGGTVRHGPVEVPGGAWIVQFADPQGAAVAVVGPRQ